MSFINSINYLLTKYGRSFIFRAITTSALDASNPTQAPTTTTIDTDIIGYSAQYKKGQVDGDLVKLEDQKFYLTTKDITFIPTINDRIIDGSNNWSILSVRSVYEGEIVVLYELQLRL